MPPRLRLTLIGVLSKTGSAFALPFFDLRLPRGVSTSSAGGPLDSRVFVLRVPEYLHRPQKPSLHISMFVLAEWDSIRTIATASAVCKLRPRPPARVERMDTLYPEPFTLYNCTCQALSSVLVLPSRRKYFQPIIFKKSP